MSIAPYSKNVAVSGTLAMESTSSPITQARRCSSVVGICNWEGCNWTRCNEQCNNAYSGRNPKAFCQPGVCSCEYDCWDSIPRIRRVFGLADNFAHPQYPICKIKMHFWSEVLSAMTNVRVYAVANVIARIVFLYAHEDRVQIIFMIYFARQRVYL